MAAATCEAWVAQLPTVTVGLGPARGDDGGGGWEVELPLNGSRLAYQTHGSGACLFAAAEGNSAVLGNEAMVRGGGRARGRGSSLCLCFFGAEKKRRGEQKRCMLVRWEPL